MSIESGTEMLLHLNKAALSNCCLCQESASRETVWQIKLAGGQLLNCQESKVLGALSINIIIPLFSLIL